MYNVQVRGGVLGSRPLVSRQFSYLGIQMATRKTRPPSKTLGARARIVAWVPPEGIGVSTSQDKWDKAKQYLAEIQAEVATGGSLGWKALESKRGFFVHLQHTDPVITPFLNGFHLTIDGWRPNRDDNLWPIMVSSKPELEGAAMALAAPPVARPAPRLQSDLDALAQLFAPEAPPRSLI